SPAPAIPGAVRWRQLAVQDAGVGRGESFCPTRLRPRWPPMIRTLILILLTAAMLWLLTSGRALAQQQPQQQPQHQPGPQRQREAQPHTQTPVRPAASVYQRRNSWYEFLLKQFNPSDVDYGQWIEQRRQAFREARLRNPYFGYSFGMTIALLLMSGVCTKLWIDHRRAMCVTAEMMTDIFNHDQYSREIARQAIEKYNDHIEHSTGRSRLPRRGSRRLLLVQM